MVSCFEGERSSCWPKNLHVRLSEYTIFTENGTGHLKKKWERDFDRVYLMVAVEKMPGWTRAAEIVLGLVSLIAGLWVIVYPGIGFLTLVLLLSIGLIFLGWRDILIGAMAKFLPTWQRALNIVLGLVAFVLSVVVIAEPGFAELSLVLLLYVALFVRGVAGISLGTSAKMFSTTLRGAWVGAGILSVILSLVFLAVPGLGVVTLIALLSIGLLITGLETIATGVIGREIVPIVSALTKK